MNNYESLTRRQKEVLKWRAIGLSKTKIAQKLHLSISTIDMHLWRIYERLGVERNSTQSVPAVLASIIYWQNNPEELKKINIENFWERNKNS
jgi:DNA-binding CsgD family transcriptional regulator